MEGISIYIIRYEMKNYVQFIFIKTRKSISKEELMKIMERMEKKTRHKNLVKLDITDNKVHPHANTSKESCE